MRRVLRFHFNLAERKKQENSGKIQFYFFFFDFGTIVAVKVNLRVGEASGVKKREQLERF